MGLKEDREALNAHIEQVHQQDVVWGKNDCTSWVSDWITKKTGKQVNGPKFSSSDEAKTIIEQEGSLANVWSKYLADLRFYEVDKPLSEELSYGDILVFETQLFGQCGGIVTTDGIVAWRSTQSIHFIKPRIIIRGWKLR